MRLLIVTPMHNEETHVRTLHERLQQQTFQQFDWIVVDDGSVDQTWDRLRSLEGRALPTVVRHENAGGLIAGSAYRAWRFGVERGLAGSTRYTHVMKLDADVRLPPEYLDLVLAEMSAETGIAGGVIVSRRMREQVHHVPGPVKLYTITAYEHLRALPSAIGFDVMDETAITQIGLSTLVVPIARFTLARAIGASEGGIHGRYRNGRVCRWTGYHPLYFAFHAARYAGRRPYVIGSAAMIWGYVRAGHGPYAPHLKRLHSAGQRGKLRAATAHPVSWLRQTYGY